ncbi:MAG: site-specific integrase, partial [Rhodospirillales bacterium]|nr:site-specific integrase [Rhodospirillales bacterium]
LGYQRNEGARAGRWFLRRSLGGHKFQIVPLGRADDERGVWADGTAILSYEQAKLMALEKLGAGPAVAGNLTVTQAMARYSDKLRAEGKDVDLMEKRVAAVVLPELGDLRIEDITSDRYRKWLVGAAARPALLRSSKRKGAKANTKAAPGKDKNEIRKRQASANRVWSMLRAALNFVYQEGLVTSDAEWRRVKPFKDVDAPRIEYLTVAEATKLIKAAPEDFRKLIQGALYTGARYGELCRLTVGDFNLTAETILIQRSKSGKSRAVPLNEEGVKFFTAIVKKRRSQELMFQHNGLPWRHGEQSRAMREACKAAKIKQVGFHILRHSYASLAVMAGMKLNALQENLGHADLRMTTRHYAHLSEDHRKEEVRQHAPKFGLTKMKAKTGT